jgi:hypothetical protein
MGHFCGYVGLPKSHPLYGVSYDELYDTDGYCHGPPEEITYSNGEAHLRNVSPSEEGEILEVWYFGFDKAHIGDLSPCRNLQYRQRRDLDAIHAMEREEIYCTMDMGRVLLEDFAAWFCRYEGNPCP